MESILFALSCCFVCKDGPRKNNMDGARKEQWSNTFVAVVPSDAAKPISKTILPILQRKHKHPSQQTRPRMLLLYQQQQRPSIPQIPSAPSPPRTSSSSSSRNTQTYRTSSSRSTLRPSPRQSPQMPLPKPYLLP